MNLTIFSTFFYTNVFYIYQFDIINQYLTIVVTTIVSIIIYLLSEKNDDYFFRKNFKDYFKPIQL